MGDICKDCGNDRDFCPCPEPPTILGWDFGSKPSWTVIVVPVDGNGIQPDNIATASCPSSQGLRTCPSTPGSP